jgi:hypothetical protein
MDCIPEELKWSEFQDKPTSLSNEHRGVIPDVDGNPLIFSATAPGH